MRRISGRAMRYQQTSSAMPLRRYFLFVGGALVALLFVVDAVLPPLTDRNAPSDMRLPKIRIYSEREGSQTVVIDTKQPTIVPDVTTQLDAAAAPLGGRCDCPSTEVRALPITDVISR